VAFTLVPRTFKLPDEMDDWAGGPSSVLFYWLLPLCCTAVAYVPLLYVPPGGLVLPVCLLGLPVCVCAHACAAWVQAHPQQDTGLWMLKNNKQRGEGLRLVCGCRQVHSGWGGGGGGGVRWMPLHGAQRLACSGARLLNFT
jgi:hypothetical protein